MLLTFEHSNAIRAVPEARGSPKRLRAIVPPSLRSNTIPKPKSEAGLPSLQDTWFERSSGGWISEPSRVYRRCSCWTTGVSDSPHGNGIGSSQIVYVRVKTRCGRFQAIQRTTVLINGYAVTVAKAAEHSSSLTIILSKQWMERTPSTGCRQWLFVIVLL